MGALGTVDFYPNGGVRYQPGCPEAFDIMNPTGTGPLSYCSHGKAWEFYAYSILHPTDFIAVKCGSYVDFLAGKCNNNPVAYMGMGALPT
jgi:hypothetical protein